MEVPTLVKRIAEECARVEGFFLTPEEAHTRRIRYPSAAQRNHNPGNIMDFAHWKATYNSETGRGEFRLQHYETDAIGWAAEYAWWLRRVSEGYTLRSAIHRKAPKGHGDNDPEKYTRIVAERANIDPDKKLSELVYAKPAKQSTS